MTAILASMLFAAPIATQLGCQNRAHTDLYQQRMAGEIRVLEDQLYEADYQNRVLRDKLQRYEPAGRIHAAAAEAPTTIQPIADPVVELPMISNPVVDTEGGFDMGHGLEDLELPSFDPGVAIDPNALIDPGAEASESLMPAPGGPEPPGKKDTEVPHIIPGDVAPPPSTEADEPKPPGQINLDAIQGAAGIPDSLRIHPALSGGQRVDGHVDGMWIVVNVVDKLGKTVDMEKFDIDAELSVVILDPEREPSEARLGRWDFSSQQVTDLVRSHPISGLHIPILWQEIEPSGDEVIVHVRLRAEDDEMRCEHRLSVERKAAIAEWTPRGDTLR